MADPQGPGPGDPSGGIQSIGATETVRPDDKIMLVLSYLGILALVPLIVVKDSPYVQWHAKQGLGLALLFLLASWVPVVNCFAFALYLTLVVVGILKSLGGVRWRIPAAAQIADKL